MLVLISLAVGMGAASIPAQAESLRTRIESLAIEHGFQLDGIERIKGESNPSVRTLDSLQQIGRLLAKYNFVIARNATGKVERLTIIGIRDAPVATRGAKPIESKTDAGEHYVNAVLAGPNGQPLPFRVMVDTGASTLVLSSSLKTQLGFSDRDLKTVRVQTANGTTMGVLGILKSVRVGDAETGQVAVTFVEDRLLGGKLLLGMSFLGRFRMTLDGRGGSLQLEERRN
ncbi:MAG: aspartyl protease family protein [Alphaproteobacteria bacterium]|jgi:aspartyl protease family protein